MRIDLPGCNFKECRYCADGNCKDINRNNGCMYKYYEAAYNKILEKGNYEDQRYPDIKGYYILLAYDKKQSKLVEVGGKWNGIKFEGIDDFYTVIAWQRCS